MEKKGGQVTKFRRATLERSEIATLLVLNFRRRTEVPALTGPHLSTRFGASKYSLIRTLKCYFE